MPRLCADLQRLCPEISAPLFQFRDDGSLFSADQSLRVGAVTQVKAHRRRLAEIPPPRLYRGSALD